MGQKIQNHLIPVKPWTPPLGEIINRCIMAVYLSLSHHLSMCLSNRPCLSVCQTLYVCLCVRLSTKLSLPACLSIYHAGCPCLSLYLSVCQTVHVCLSLPGCSCLSARLCMSVCLPGCSWMFFSPVLFMFRLWPSQPNGGQYLTTHLLCRLSPLSG